MAVVVTVSRAAGIIAAAALQSDLGDEADPHPKEN